MQSYRLHKLGVIGLDAGGKAHLIPAEPTLRAWQDYQRWLAAGNAPLPDIDSIAEDDYRAQVQALETEIAGEMPSWNQIETAIDAAFSNLWQRGVVKKMARVLYLTVRRRLT